MAVRVFEKNRYFGQKILKKSAQKTDFPWKKFQKSAKIGAKFFKDYNEVLEIFGFSFGPIFIYYITINQKIINKIHKKLIKRVIVQNKNRSRWKSKCVWLLTDLRVNFAPIFVITFRSYPILPWFAAFAGLDRSRGVKNTLWSRCM